MKNFARALLFLLAVVPLGANPIEATFDGVNGDIAFGYYVGPYYGRLEQQPVVLDCVDFANEVSFGQQWQVNLSHIDTPQDLAYTRFGAMPNALQLYQEAAWLTEQYAVNPASAYGDIQATIWQLFDLYAPSPATGYWLSQAQAKYASGNYADFFVVTNVGPVNSTGQEQEFLTVLDPTMAIYPVPTLTTTGLSDNLATPEPRWLLAPVLGVIGVAVLVSWRRKKAPYH